MPTTTGRLHRIEAALPRSRGFVANNFVPTSYARVSNGLCVSAPRSATSATLPVTSVIPCVLAVAASSASIVDREWVALIRPHSSATAWSTGRMRSPKDVITSASHFSDARAWAGSVRLDRSMPLRILPTTRRPIP
jgi:hypothetical protein